MTSPLDSEGSLRTKASLTGSSSSRSAASLATEGSLRATAGLAGSSADRSALTLISEGSLRERVPQWGTLTRTFTLSVASASFELAAQAVTITAKRQITLAVTSASFELTPQTVGLSFPRRVLQVASAAFELAANTVTLALQKTLTVASASFELAAQAVGLTSERGLAVASAEFEMTAQDVTLTYTPAGSADIELNDEGANTYTSSGQDDEHTFTVGIPAAGSNRKVIVVATSEVGGARTHSGMTFNGVAMSLAVKGTDAYTNSRVSMWYIDDDDLPEEAGTYNVTLSLSGNANVLMACAGTYLNVAQGAPSGTGQDNNTSGALLSITLDGVSEGALVVDGLVCSNNERFTPGENQTERWDFGGTGNAHGNAGSDIIGASAGDVTVTQDIANGAPDMDYIAAWWPKAA